MLFYKVVDCIVESGCVKSGPLPVPHKDIRWRGLPLIYMLRADSSSSSTFS